MSFNSTIGSFGASYNGFTLGAVLAVVMVGAVVLGLSYLPFFNWLSRLLGKTGRGLVLAFKGAGIFGTFLGMYWTWEYIFSWGSEIGFEPIWILYGGGGLAGLIVLGRLGETVYARILDNVRRAHPGTEGVGEILGANVKKEGSVSG